MITRYESAGLCMFTQISRNIHVITWMYIIRRSVNIQFFNGPQFDTKDPIPSSYCIYSRMFVIYNSTHSRTSFVPCRCGLPVNCAQMFHPKFGDFTSDFTSNPGRRRFGSLIRAWRELLVGVSRYEWIRNQ